MKADLAGEVEIWKGRIETFCTIWLPSSDIHTGLSAGTAF